MQAELELEAQYLTQLYQKEKIPEESYYTYNSLLEKIIYKLRY